MNRRIDPSCATVPPRVARSWLPIVGTLAILMSLSSKTHAQDVEGVEPEPEPGAFVEPEPAPAAPTMTMTADSALDPSSVPVETGAPPQSPEAQPEKSAGPKLQIGVGLRTGLAISLNNPDDEVKVYLDDGLVDQLNIRPYMAGQLNEYVGFFTSLEIGTSNFLDIHVLDAILQLHFLDEIQLWIGQHIGANDRNNMNGPFFGNGWNFAIAVPSYPFDVGARDQGFTLWGLIAEGRVKYHLSVLDAQKFQNAQYLRYGGRVTVHLLEPENFYYNSGTYFGTKDVLALGAVANYQKGVPGTNPDTGVALDNDFFGYSFDALFEKNLGVGGTVTLELGYWDFTNVGVDYVSNQGTVDTGFGVAGPFPGRALLAAASWLSPNKLGIGQLQPNFRYQLGDYDGSEANHVFDVGLGYIIDGFNNRWYVNYRHVSGPVDEDILQIGGQVQL